jgi:hypothetical protein
MCDVGHMAQILCVIVSALDREGLQAIVADRNRRQRHVERARIVLASADAGRFSGLLRASASAGRWYGVGNTASPKRGSRVCCATRPASPASPPIAGR